MSPQNTPVEVSILETLEPNPRAGVIVDSFALYAVRLVEPLIAGDRTIQSVIALRRWPGLDAIVSHDERVVVQLFLLHDQLTSFAEFAWHNLAHDVETTGALKLRKP